MEPISALRSRFDRLTPGKKAAVAVAAIVVLVAGGAYVAKAFHVAAGIVALFTGRRAFSRTSDASAEADAFRADAASATAAGDLRPVHAEDRQRDATATETAANAGKDAGKDAAGGWTRNAHRKPPSLPGIVVFFALSAAMPARADDDNCVPVANYAAPPSGFGYWREASGEYYCPCFGRVDDFYDATRLPGGCLVPPMLPLVAYTIDDNAQMWAHMEAAASRIKSLDAEVATVRGQRDDLAGQLQTCGLKLNRAADVIEVPKAALVEVPPSRLEWYGYGAASALAAALVAVLLLD